MNVGKQTLQIERMVSLHLDAILGPAFESNLEVIDLGI